jgi:4-hydroxy-2-oxoheptanedioate aldolase
MRENMVKAKWRAGEPVFGAWLSLPDAHAAETMAQAGFDYLCVDMQHGVIGYESAVGMLRAICTGASMPFVRVPWNEPGIIGKMLDAGAYGVIIPMVNTRAEAEAAVAACRYAPKGHRSYGPNRVTYYAGSDYFDHANDAVACIPMIETTQAIDSLDEILAVPGIDAIYVGPADLSITLGLPPRPDNGPAFHEALARIVTGCQKHGVVPGVHANAQLARARIEAGFRMITISNDVAAMARAAAEDLRTAGESRESVMPQYS